MAIRIPVNVQGRPIDIDIPNDVDDGLFRFFRDLLAELEEGDARARLRIADERLGRLISSALGDFHDSYSDRSLRSLDILERYAAIREDIAAHRVVDDSRARQLLEELRELDQERLDTPESALQQAEPTPERYTNLEREADDLQGFIDDSIERLGGIEPEGTQPIEVSGQEVSRQTVLFEPEPIGPDVPARLVRGYRDIDINEIPPTLRTEFEIDWETYTGRMRPLGKEAYIRYRYLSWGVEHGIFRRGSPYLEPIFPGRIGALAERIWSHITETPQNPGAERGGRFETSWGNVEPDFIPAVDRNRRIVFGSEPEYAGRNNVPSIDDALLVADSKFYGVYRDVPVINFGIFGNHANQVRGMIWLSHRTKSKTFVFLGRPNQRSGRNIQDFARQFGVDVRITSDPRIR